MSRIMSSKRSRFAGAEGRRSMEHEKQRNGDKEGRKVEKRRGHSDHVRVCQVLCPTGEVGSLPKSYTHVTVHPAERKGGRMRPWQSQGLLYKRCCH